MPKTNLGDLKLLRRGHRKRRRVGEREHRRMLLLLADGEGEEGVHLLRRLKIQRLDGEHLKLLQRKGFPKGGGEQEVVVMTGVEEEEEEEDKAREDGQLNLKDRRLLLVDGERRQHRGERGGMVIVVEALGTVGKKKNGMKMRTKSGMKKRTIGVVRTHNNTSNNNNPMEPQHRVVG